MTNLPILPTTVVGSHAKPGWWHKCKDSYAKGEWGSEDLEELLRDAVDIAILDQARAGLDIITDGESRRLESKFHDGRKGKSIDPHPVVRFVDKVQTDQIMLLS